MAWRTGFVVVVALVTQVLSKPQFASVAFVEDEPVSDAQSRIVSGWEATPGQHPHQVSLRMVTPAGALSACGGSVVHANWVLTAAHCTTARVNAIISAGTTNLLTSPEYLSESNIWFNHPMFDESQAGTVQPNDIAVIQLQEPITFSDLVKPIRIQPSYDAHRNYGNEIVVASGFGRTWTGGEVSQVLNWVYLEGITNALCYATYGAIITDTSICAKHYNETSQSICQGDSGGPLVFTDSDEIPTLIGISSFVAGGEYGCHSGLPAGFIRPGPYHSWIREVTGIDFDTYLPTTPNPDETTTNPDSESTTANPDGHLTATTPEYDTTANPDGDSSTPANPDGDSTTTNPEGDNQDSTTENPDGGLTTSNPDEDSTTSTDDPDDSDDSTDNPNGRPPRPPTDNENKPPRPPTGEINRPPKPPTDDNENKPKPPGSQKPKPPTGKPPRPPTDDDDDSENDSGNNKPSRPPKEDSSEDSDSNEDSSEERRALKNLMKKLNVKVNVNVEINQNSFKTKHQKRQ